MRANIDLCRNMPAPHCLSSVQNPSINHSWNTSIYQALTRILFAGSKKNDFEKRCEALLSPEVLVNMILSYAALI